MSSMLPMITGSGLPFARGRGRPKQDSRHLNQAALKLSLN